MTCICAPLAQALLVSPSARLQRGRRRRLPAPRCQSGSSDEGRSLREQAKRLEQLFYGERPTELGAAAPPEHAATPAVLRDLPLWRVQWAVLPGYQEVLHVHVPHYSDMFNRMFIGQPRPWRFGHLLLPGGSASLGEAEYALAQGSKAPLVGTVMEVVQAVRYPDGRLLILAVGLGRFKVLNALQTVPHSRADVLLLPNAEEAQAGEDAVGAALEALPPDATTSLAMRAATAAARQAAGAAAQAWWEYEVSGGRVLERAAVVDGEDEATAMEFGRRLVAISSSEVLVLPYADEAAGADVGGREAAVLRDVACAADSAAGRAAAEFLAAVGAAASAAQPATDTADGATADDNSWKVLLEEAASAGGTNSVSDRGLSTVGAATFLGEDPGERLPDGEERALLLESAVWEELDAVKLLAEKISGRPAPVLPGLLCLRPPSSVPTAKVEVDAAMGVAAARTMAAHASYPALRRAQRLSYVLCSCLGDVSERGPAGGAGGGVHHPETAARAGQAAATPWRAGRGGGRTRAGRR